MVAVPEPPVPDTEVRTEGVTRRPHGWARAWDHGWAYAYGSVMAVTVCFAAVLVTGVGGVWFTQMLANLALPVVSGMAGVSCFVHSRAMSARTGAGWALIGAGALCWCLGDICRFVLETVNGAQAPVPSVADVGYLAMIPLTGAGLLLLPDVAASVADRARSVLDGLMVAGSLLLIAWLFVVRPMLAVDAESTLTRMVNLAYPVGDIVLVTIVAYLLAQQRRQGHHLRQLVLLGSGIVAFAVADVGYAYLNLVDAYATGSSPDIGWFAGFALIVLATRLPAAPPPAAPPPAAALPAAPPPAAAPPAGPVPVGDTPPGARGGRDLSVLLPYVAVVAAMVTSIAWSNGTGKADFVVSSTRSVLILLIIGRQMLTMLENRNLTRDLESRVSERTAELYVREQRFQALVQHSNDVVTVVDPRSEVLYQSESVQRVFGYPARWLTGRRLVELVDRRATAVLVSALESVLRAPGSSAIVELDLRHRDGRPRLAEVTVTNLLDDPSVGGVVFNTRDISQRRELQDQLVHEAYHDALTQLPNRALLRERTRQALAARRPSDDVAVLYLDLDGFKEVNDSLGHLAGDDLLMRVAGRLRAAVRDDDIVARCGGDEFAVLTAVPQDAPDARAVAQRIVDALAAPFRIGAREIHVRASIGVASASTSAAGGVPAAAAGDVGEQLICNADIAMYRAKSAGGGIVEYDPAMLAGLVERLELEADLRGAVERGELELHYQPTVRLADNRIVGFEALVRWRHPGRGLIPPLDFIPLAEATGLIAGIGTWVLREACRQGAQWAARPGRQPITMAVNLSVRQFHHGDLPSVLAEVLTETKMPADRLCLEMTESVLMDDTQENLSQLVRLKALGVTLAIDDFGTGYSSLAYLRRFPVDTLKIDRSFVRRLGEQSDDAALADTIVQLGRSLGMSTIAEGIEEFGQLAALREMGCDYAQGFYFSRPLPAREAEQLLDGTPATVPTPG